MANTKNVILNLPFDESDGSLIAYDYSANRADGIVCLLYTSPSPRDS